MIGKAATRSTRHADEHVTSYLHAKRRIAEGRIDMTRRVLTTIGSAAAVATAVGTCLLLGPTPQAQATTIGNCATGCVNIGTGTITATSGNKSAVVQFFGNMVCATASNGTTMTQKCGSF
jgi:hypothetical protein